MAWRDLTSEEREAEIKAQGKWLPPGSGLEEQFGIKWDKAADDGAPFELTAGQMFAAQRLGMPPGEYSALLRVKSVDDFRDFQESEQLLQRAADEIRLDQAKAELQGGRS
jgi:hypothetical protein